MVLNQAGITLNQNDRVLLNGLQTTLTEPITAYLITLQIRRAVGLTLVTSDGEQKLQSSAFTVGEVLQEASYWLHAEDIIELALDIPITDGLKITVTSPHELSVSVSGKTLQIQSSARTIGEALAEAGIPLLGLDYSVPAESDAPPSDGQIRVVRVNESVLLAQKSIPFENDFQASADIPLDQTQIIQPGETGLTVQRIRIRYEDGKEIARLMKRRCALRRRASLVMGRKSRSRQPLWMA